MHVIYNFSPGMSYGHQTKTKRTAAVWIVERYVLCENRLKIPEVVSEKTKCQGETE